jgi:tripartite-type tricarboxylate transporter receptor subunit TctC
MRAKMAGLVVLWALIALALLTPASAQSYPDRPIKLIMPFPAGGAADVLGRAVAQAMSPDLGQQVFVENRVGAGGALGFAEATKAAPDGYTLVWTSISLPVVAATIPSLNFDPKSFTHISKTAENPFILVVNSQVPVKTVAELVALAKSKPNGLNFAHNGPGTLTKLILSLFAVETGIELNEVSYRGDNFSSTDVLAGHVQGMFANSPVAVPHMASGGMRGLAVTSPKRSPAAPDVPTMTEAGVKGVGAVIWHGVSAPAGTPKPIVDKLNAAVSKALKSPELVASFERLGSVAAGSTPEEYQKLVGDELVYWADVAKKTAGK